MVSLMQVEEVEDVITKLTLVERILIAEEPLEQAVEEEEAETKELRN
tara:strand:- start:168 stop:308 length:141 start_codon:yes stop_codon:yes gene_type:complete